MFGLLTTLVLATDPALPPKPVVAPAEQIRNELRQKIIPLLMSCDDLIEAAGIQDGSSQIEFRVGPTGKAPVGGKPPSEPFSMLVWRCGLAAIGPSITVKVKNVTSLETWDWGYTVPPGAGNGLAWVADDPKALDREVVIATPKQTWIRCEHKDAALSSHGAAKDVAKLSTLPDFKAAVEDSGTDTSPFWKLVRTKDGKHEVSAHRAELPAWAKAFDQATGAKTACDPVRALGEKADALLTNKSKSLAACLKHRHNDLWLTLTLNGGGAVIKADASATSGLDDKALGCLEKTAARWSFPYKGESGATLSAHLQAAPPGE